MILDLEKLKKSIMNKRNFILDLFTEDVNYNYHLIETNDPKGHLIYVIKNGSNLKKDTLEFSPTIIVEQLMSDCCVKFDKFAPSVFFTDMTNTKDLKDKLNEKLSEDKNFSMFIEKIKNKYRILEIKDSLFYKKDPKAYEKLKIEEHEKNQKDILNRILDEFKKNKEKREKIILNYNNDILKFLKDYIKETIDSLNDEDDFDLNSEFIKFIEDFAEPNIWSNLNNSYIPNIQLYHFSKNFIKVYIKISNELYSATLKLEKSSITNKQLRKINKQNVTKEYDLLSKMFNINTKCIKDWDLKFDSEKIKYIIEQIKNLKSEEI